MLNSHLRSVKSASKLQLILCLCWRNSLKNTLKAVWFKVKKIFLIKFHIQRLPTAEHRIELGHTEFISECPKPKQKENKIQKRPFVSLEFSNQNCAKSREIVAEWSTSLTWINLKQTKNQNLWIYTMQNKIGKNLVKSQNDQQIKDKFIE